ncbi:MAG: glycosyltransferase [Dehalococcoidia bacterium]|nr:glycosyltransferase [Dehalococcoidia bacterium]
MTGYPVREAFFSTTRQEAREQLGIRADERVLLVAGASQGSQTINRMVFEALPALLKHATVLHITGGSTTTWREAWTRLPTELRQRYHPSAFREDMPALMRAADLAIMRAGASVIGELPAAALPALLVPGTFAGGHQRANAAWLAEQGAAEMVEEQHLDALGARAIALLDNAQMLTEMRNAASSLARPDAAKDIADLVTEVARR